MNNLGIPLRLLEIQTIFRPVQILSIVSSAAFRLFPHFGQFSHIHTMSNMQWRLGDLLQNPGIVFLCNSLHFSIPLYQCDHTGHHGLKFNLNIILSHILSTFSCSKWKYKSIFCPEPLIFLFIFFFWMRWHIPLTTNWEGHCFIINATLE